MNEENNKERENESSSYEEDIKMSSPFIKKLENFFYHYKWHTVLALFLVFTIVICSFQMCQKTSYDAYVMYAGGREIQKNSSTDISDYQKLSSAIKQYSKDFDEDGSTNVLLQNLFIPSAEDIAAAKEQYPDHEPNYSLIAQDTEMFNQSILYGEYYICLLSESLFKERTKDSDTQPFAVISPYTNGNDGDYEYVSDYGIYLRSTSLYQKEGFSLLPDDTVICIRIFSEVSSRFNKADNEENYRNSVTLLQAMLKNG